MLRDQETLYVKELEEFYDRRRSSFDSALEARRLAGLYGNVALWFEAQAAAYKSNDHYDALYVARILLEPAEEHRTSGRAGRPFPNRESVVREAEHEYRRLAALFSARLTSFERKRYENLSHASNKAMNLNSYLGLLGKRFREVVRAGKLHLVECESEPAQLVVPDADYVITVDADSMLLGKYALNLTHIMSRPESARFGVVQSPFSAVPGSPGTSSGWPGRKPTSNGSRARVRRSSTRRSGWAPTRCSDARRSKTSLKSFTNVDIRLSGTSTITRWSRIPSQRSISWFVDGRSTTIRAAVLFGNSERFRSAGYPASTLGQWSAPDRAEAAPVRGHDQQSPQQDA